MILNGITEVAKETQIHPSTLRRWESLGLITPGRILLGENMVRVYSDEETQLLKGVKELMNQGYRLRAAFAIANEEEEE